MANQSQMPLAPLNYTIALIEAYVVALGVVRELIDVVNNSDTQNQAQQHYHVTWVP